MFDVAAGQGGRELGRLVQCLRCIDDSYRRFDLDEEAAGRNYRIDRAVLDAAVGRGLPHTRGATGRRFDDIDLLNLSLQTTDSVHRWSIAKFWPTAMTPPTGGAEPEYELRYVAGCPEPGHDGPCRFESLLPGGHHREQTDGARPGDRERTVASCAVTLGRTRSPVPGGLRDLLVEAASYRFIRFPTGMPAAARRQVLDEAHATDCAGISGWLQEEAPRLGTEISPAFGLLVTQPYSTPHAWNVVTVDGGSIAVDPLMISAMHRWGVLSPEALPVWSSLDHALVDLGRDWVPLVTHNESKIDVTVRTRRVNSGEKSAGAVKIFDVT